MIKQICDLDNTNDVPILVIEATVCAFVYISF